MGMVDYGEALQLQRELARAHNFQPRFHRLEIYGLCEDCREDSTTAGLSRPS